MTTEAERILIPFGCNFNNNLSFIIIIMIITWLITEILVTQTYLHSDSIWSPLCNTFNNFKR